MWWVRLLIRSPLIQPPGRPSVTGGLRRASVLVLVALALAACAGAPRGAAPAADAERLPIDPGLVTGVLDNGLAYAVRRHANPEGRIGIWLHVATGSLNETEDTRGIAHYLEHMAFNGTANFPPGSLIPFFQSLGMTFGRDQNAFTSFDQTVYTLALPDTRAETLDRALLYLADVAFRMDLHPDEIEAERQIILEEKRARAGAGQRVRDEVLRRLAPESTLGRRLPIGTAETIRAIGQAELREYYERWYVPGNMTVIAVGDMDPLDVIEAIDRHFGSAPPAPRPEPRPVGVRPTTGTRAIVVADPGLAQAEVSLTRVEPPRPPVTTMAAYRRQLVERLGVVMFNRRLAAELAEGRVAFVGGGAMISQRAGAVRMVTARATAPPEHWRAALADLATALQRARQHGFTPAELDEARLALRAQAEEAAQRESTLPARRLLQLLNESVARREPPMAGAQRLALVSRLLPGIEVEEVGRAFAAAFDPDNAVLVLTAPASADVPTEAALVGLGRTALDVRPSPPVERARPASLLAAAPAGGRVLEAQGHEATAVWSAWLDNGVRVRHRHVDQRRNEATITITLAGGVIQEDPENRGVTEAAVGAWNRPATSRLSSTEIRTLMTGRRVRVSAHAGPDTVTLAVSGDPAELEHGLALAYLLLTDPVVEGPAFEQWRAEQLRQIAERAREPRGALAEALADALYPAAEARVRPATAAPVRALTREATERWLRALAAQAPMEVTVVGDIDRAPAAALVARYLGALPPRERIGPATLAGLRELPRPAGPIRVVRTVETRTAQAQVLGGFFGPDLVNVRDSRLFAVAARVLSTRMNRALREERQLVYSIGTRLTLGEAYPGFGFVAAGAPTDPEKTEALADAIEAMFTAFAAEGPTDEELAVARQQLETFLDESMRGPDFWRDRLATLDYRGLSLDDLSRIVADYRSFTAAEVREAFARYARPEARIRVVILPQPPR